MDEELEEGQVIGFVGEAFGVPLDAQEQRQGGIFGALDDAVGGGADDAQAAADLVDRLLVIAVGVDFGFIQ